MIKLKTLPKKLKDQAYRVSILKIVKYSELTSIDFVPSPKCTFLPSQCEKTDINIAKHWSVFTCSISNAPNIFSYSSQSIRYINTTVQHTAYS
jgi:hypothetical protein